MKSNVNNSKKGESLLRRFEEIHDYIYANEGLSSQQTLNEFIKILFVKIVDEGQEHQQFYYIPLCRQSLPSGGCPLMCS